MSVKGYALAAIKRGWPIIPLNGKIPMTKNGSKDATIDAEKVKEWFYDWPTMNYGIVTGPGLYVIDIDGPEGQAALEKLPPLPETFTVETGRGTHYYFAWDAPLKNTASKLGKNIDTRGTGGYVVGPGSIHPDTKAVYKLINNGELAPLPNWVVDRVTEKEVPQKPPRKRIQFNGQDNYIKRAMDGIYNDIANAPSGTRNNALNGGAYRLGKFVNTGLITDDYAMQLLENAGHDAGLSHKEIAHTARSGLEKGIASGALIDLQEMPQADYTPPPIEAAPTKETVKKSNYADLVSLGEIGDAQIFVEQTRGELIFNHTAGKWMEYIDGRWEKDNTHRTRRKVFDVLYPIYKDLAVDAYNQKMSAIAADNNEQAKKWTGKHKELERRLKSLGGLNKAKTILEFASGMAGTENECIDRDPLLLNLKNGTYDFRTRELRKHKHTDFISKQADIQFDPKAVCSNWMLFLCRIFDNDELLIEYVQKIAGLCLTGSNDYQHLFFCYGSGANGKSTFFNAMCLILNDFYVSIPSDVLLTKQKSSSDEYHVARLKGARLAVASEIPANRRLQESLVKDLTSNDLLIARNPYEKPFNFEPTHKLWMFGNHKPYISGSDHGIWRRIRLIPFEVQIPESERRPNAELMAEFTKEKSGILNWMIEGYYKLIDHGLTLPPKVEAATQDYQDDSDTFKQFGNSNLAYNHDLKLPLVILWEAYEKWCTDENEYNPFKNKRQFARGLRERGLDVKKLTDNKTFVVGVGFKSNV